MQHPAPDNTKVDQKVIDTEKEKEQFSSFSIYTIKQKQLTGCWLHYIRKAHKICGK
jgi:hypothetical protein